MNHKLFGWAKNREGKTVCVSDVPKGKDCGCFCPFCNAELIARKGEVRMHHFAHTKGMECQYGYEASVHLLAKEVFQQTKTMLLPQFALRYELKDGAEKVLIHNSRKKEKRACELHDDELTELMRVYAPKGTPYYADEHQKPAITFDDVLVEQFRKDVKPDATAIKAGHELFVEFMFSHAVDDVKYKKLVEYRYTCVEVDLSNIELHNNREEDFAMMKDYLSDISNIRWIYYPDAIEKIRKELRVKKANHKESLRRNRGSRIPRSTNYRPERPKPIYSPAAPYNKFEYQTNCDYILNRVEKGNDDVCDYVKRLRNMDGQQWEYIYSGWRQECRNCPDHRIVGGKIFCDRYTNHI